MPVIGCWRRRPPSYADGEDGKAGEGAGQPRRTGRAWRRPHLHHRRQACRRRRRAWRKRGLADAERYASSSTACCSANQEAVVQVTPRFPGIVRAIRKRIGDHVRQGRCTRVHREQPEPDTVYELKASHRGHRHRPADIAWRVRVRAEAGLRRRRPVAPSGSICRSIGRTSGASRIGDEVLIDPDDGGGDVEAKIVLRRRRSAAATHRRALARVVVAESRIGRLRPGLFVTARLILAEARRWPSRCDSLAIQTLENKTVVFVRESDDKIEARPVELGDSRSASSSRSKSAFPAGERYVAGEQFRREGRDGQGRGGPP